MSYFVSTQNWTSIMIINIFSIQSYVKQVWGLTLVTVIIALFQGCSGDDASLHSAEIALPEGPKLYVLDCGRLTFRDVTPFGLSNDQTAIRELFVPCYLITHQDRSLLWDAGLPLKIVGQGAVPFSESASMSYDRSVIDQLTDIGYTPANLDYLALSHMHFDHAGAANAFTQSTLLIQASEHEAAFRNAEQFEVFDPSLYSELADGDIELLQGDHDVFGDGSVVIKAAPGHTPGHQVLFINLENYGPLLLSGDMYHFRVSRELQSVPVFNFDREMTLESMDRIENFINEKKVTLWIEHDLKLAQSLTLSPAYYD